MIQFSCVTMCLHFLSPSCIYIFCLCLPLFVVACYIKMCVTFFVQVVLQSVSLYLPFVFHWFSVAIKSLIYRSFVTHTILTLSILWFSWTLIVMLFFSLVVNLKSFIHFSSTDSSLVIDISLSKAVSIDDVKVF